MVSPVTKVDIVSGRTWCLAVSDEYLIQYGKDKYKKSLESGAKNPVNPNEWLNIKRRYERYAQYKRAIAAEAKRVLYLPRTNNFWVKFYMPMPKSWPRKKKNILAWEPCLSRPDVDNLLKGFIDGLFPEEDKGVWDYRASKLWTPTEFGFIDIEIGNLPPVKANIKSLASQTDELK